MLSINFQEEDLDEGLVFLAPGSTVSCLGEEPTVKAGGIGSPTRQIHRHSTMRLKLHDEEEHNPEEDEEDEEDENESAELGLYEDIEEYRDGEGESDEYGAW